MDAKEIYRKSALDKLSVPEQLDKTIPVTKPSYWILIIGILILLACLLVWSILGRIDVTVDATSIFFTRGYANSYYSDISGVITSVHAKQGDFVDKDQVIFDVKSLDDPSKIEHFRSPVYGLITSYDVVVGSEISVNQKLLTIRCTIEKDGNTSTMTNYSGNDKDFHHKTEQILYCCVPMNDYDKVSLGMDVELYPWEATTTGFDYLKGKISHISGYVASEKDYQAILGVDFNIESYLPPGGTIIMECSLNEDTNNNSGYSMHTQYSDDFNIPEASIYTAKIIIQRIRPINIIFPDFKLDL